MIGEYTLLSLCEKYHISSENIINKNNNILTYGEYNEINDTLSFLINEFGVSPKNIEKCPSILYRNVNYIKKNLDFLREKGIGFQNIESCLHVLTSEPNDLKDTYEYVIDNYGLSALNKSTSVLSSNVNIIKDVESMNIPIPKNGNLSISALISFGFTNINDIQKIIKSEEFKEHPELFTSTTLAHAKLEDIQKIINSNEFKEHPEMFTSQTLAYAKLDEIQKIIRSDEFKTHPEMFTSTTLANAKLDEIQKIINSEEFKEHPEMFTSTTLAHAKLDDIQGLLDMECWKDERFEKLLTPSIAAKSKSMISKLPILISIAEEYNIDGYLNANYLLKSPSQDYALIQYFNENNIPLVIDNKLNSMFSYQPGALKKKYNIDLDELIKKYPLSIEKYNNGGKKL